jgi:hypothetical protein
MALYTAIIIEPRKHRALQFVLQNFLENLSDEWNIIIFHGNENDDFVKDIVTQISNERIIKLVNLNVANLTYRTYSQLFTSKNIIYPHIDTETFLIFQTDSMIFSKNRHFINDFLEYDYVGAPWKCGNIGNGGLSLRKKSKMLEIIENHPYNGWDNEDMYFSFQKKIEYKKPEFEKAKTFSVETVFHENCFGVHNCWKYLQTSELDQLKDLYPEINTLIELNQ